MTIGDFSDSARGVRSLVLYGLGHVVEREGIKPGTYGPRESDGIPASERMPAVTVLRDTG